MNSDIFYRLIPNLGQVSRAEQLRASIGALVGIALTGTVGFLVLGADATGFFLVAPMGASAVLLFAVPSSPLAQPWSILGGNISAALIGITCRLLIPDSIMAASVAVCLAIAAMFLLRCLHPPAGAVAVTTIFAGPGADALGYSFAFVPIGLNSLLMLMVALAFNNLTGHRYPQLRPSKRKARATCDALPDIRSGFALADLDRLLKERDEVVDIDRNELVTLLRTAEEDAFNRRSHGLVCADVMSRDVVSVSPGTSIGHAWHIMRDRGLRVLPVAEDDRTIVGMIALEDFVHVVGRGVGRLSGRNEGHLKSGIKAGFSTRLNVDRIMTKPEHRAYVETPIADLIPFMAQARTHSLPVVDKANHLIGLVTQTDLILAVFKRGEFVERRM